MFKSAKLLVAVVLAGSALLAAPAQAIPLTAGGTLTSGDLLFTIISCAGSACSTGELVASGYSVTIDNSGGTGNLETAGSGAYAYADTTVKFSVQVTDGAYLNGVNLSTTMSGNLSSFGETFSTDGSTVTAGTSSAPGTNQTATASKVFYAKSVNLSLDMAAQDSNTGGATVKSVSQSFNVPEPASMGLLAIGLAAVSGLRRRRPD